MKIKKITVTYIEEKQGKRKIYSFEGLSLQDQERFMEFFNMQNNIEPSEIKIYIPVQNQKKGKKIDVICPIYWVNKYFLHNVSKWFEQIPIRTLYLGVNNKTVKIETDDPRIKIIDQTQHKTLGICLSELMSLTETEFFIYTHADVEPVFGSYKIMVSEINDDIGIIESDHIHWDGSFLNDEMVISENHNYRARPRAYSGFQLIRKKAIEPILTKIEDDYIYRNEDLIFQTECMKNNYRYRKSLSSHIHQVINQKWTFNTTETNIMQIKGLIKYTQPHELIKNSLIASLKWCKIHKKIRLKDILFFCYEHNPNWSEIVTEVFKN